MLTPITSHHMEKTETGLKGLCIQEIMTELQYHWYINYCTTTVFDALEMFVRLRISQPKDKASGVKFCSAVHRRPRQGTSHFGELCSPKAQSLTNRPARPGCNVMLLGFCESYAYQVRAACGRIWPAYVDVRQSPKTDLLVIYCFCFAVLFLVFDVGSPATFTTHWSHCNTVCPQLPIFSVGCPTWAVQFCQYKIGALKRNDDDSDD